MPRTTAFRPVGLLNVSRRLTTQWRRYEDADDAKNTDQNFLVRKLWPRIAQDHGERTQLIDPIVARALRGRGFITDGDSPKVIGEERKLIDCD